MSLNRAMVIGNLGSDPVLRNLPSGQAVVFSMATEEAIIDKRGQKQERVESLWNDRLRFALFVDSVADRIKSQSAELHAKEPVDEEETTICRTGCIRG
jgi:Single-strand binding protein family